MRPARLVIDPVKLPQFAAIDAGVLIRALEPEHTDRYAAACRDFWTAMLAKPGHEIMIPAPSLAEYLKGAKTPFPNASQAYVVAFDARAAELLAAELADAIKDGAAELKRRFGPDAPGALIKYDAMIVACAKRWKAQRLITIDRHLKSFADRVQLSCVTPDFFYASQTALDLQVLDGGRAEGGE